MSADLQGQIRTHLNPPPSPPRDTPIIVTTTSANHSPAFSPKNNKASSKSVAVPSVEIKLERIIAPKTPGRKEKAIMITEWMEELKSGGHQPESLGTGFAEFAHRIPWFRDFRSNRRHPFRTFDCNVTPIIPRSRGNSYKIRENISLRFSTSFVPPRNS